jgi:hypothetical protein
LPRLEPVIDRGNSQANPGTLPGVVLSTFGELGADSRAIFLRGIDSSRHRNESGTCLAALDITVMRLPQETMSGGFTRLALRMPLSFAVRSWRAFDFAQDGLSSNRIDDPTGSAGFPRLQINR